MARSYLVNAVDVALAADVAPSDVSITVDDASDLPIVPFYLVVDPLGDTTREYMYCTGVNINVLFVNRNLAGTESQTHLTGDLVRISYVAQILDDLWDDLDAIFPVPGLGAEGAALRKLSATDGDYSWYPNVTLAITEPPSPLLGDLWMDTDSGTGTEVYLRLDGTLPMSGHIDMSGFSLDNVAFVNSQDGGVVILNGTGATSQIWLAIDSFAVMVVTSDNITMDVPLGLGGNSIFNTTIITAQSGSDLIISAFSDKIQLGSEVNLGGNDLSGSINVNIEPGSSSWQVVNAGKRRIQVNEVNDDIVWYTGDGTTLALHWADTARRFEVLNQFKVNQDGATRPSIRIGALGGEAVELYVHDARRMLYNSSDGSVSFYQQDGGTPWMSWVASGSRAAFGPLDGSSRGAWFEAANTNQVRSGTMRFLNPPTTTAAGNMVFGTTGTGGEYLINRSTSSLQYKENVRSIDYDEALAIVKGLDPIEFSGIQDVRLDRDETEEDWVHDPEMWIGFGAEPTNELDERLGQHENYDVRGIVGALVKVVQELVAD